ncbi:MAG: Gfo/Idh/MocA family oxidoreductase [Victivallales bacterium]|nr:Gfo/Idh/MocA family oxidoreductase [Victivallales bacterium]
MKKFKVGIIGCGRISPFHGMPAKAQNCVKLVAVCDVDRNAAQDRAKLFGVSKIYTDYEEMITKEKLDVVHICLPHYLHAPVAIRAMELGCHVLTEKPMAISYKQAADMVKASKRTGRQLGVIFQNRYNAGSRLVKRALDSGSLGKILSARCTVNWFRSDEYYTESDWKGTWEKEGGGSIIDQAIHTIDLMCWMIGYGEKGENLESCDVTLANRAHQGIIEVEDCADGLITFKNGTRASFWCMNYYSSDASVEIEFACEKGTAHIKAEEGRVVLDDGHEFVAKPDPSEVFDYGGGPSYWGASHYKEITDFYEALASGEEPPITGEEILDTAHRLIMGLYDSGRKKKVVKF